MAFLRRFGAFWFDFVVGDDWLLAAGVLVALVLTSVAARSLLQSSAWVILPVLAVLVLAASLWRAARSK